MSSFMINTEFDGPGPLVEERDGPFFITPKKGNFKVTIPSKCKGVLCLCECDVCKESDFTEHCNVIEEVLLPVGNAQRTGLE